MALEINKRTVSDWRLLFRTLFPVCKIHVLNDEMFTPLYSSVIVIFTEEIVHVEND